LYNPLVINFNGSTGFRKPCDEQLFNFGLGFGVVFMVTSSKKEIEKLRELQKQTERLVKDLKEEVSRRNFSNDSSQIVQNGEDMLSEHHYAKREIESYRKEDIFRKDVGTLVKYYIYYVT